ncbi:sigma-70 family RNA polymerase sigma factor [Halosquirtibacter xylanolyticus]|uniref:RNA polymerase sigma factor n=1 Tax=Halosquirtibacter xylanolyticus TaxID=3374599 RepID=UPI003748FEA8|nr:sigma-70 family RNA polymerase sigma factor [Prolixibacteraceae bacterium]
MGPKSNIITDTLRLRLIQFARTFMTDYAYAEDVVQDVQLKLLSSNSALDNVDNIEAFLFRMVRNRCLDLIKVKRNKFTLLENNMDCEDRDLMHLIESKEMSQVAVTLMEELPEKQRMVIYLNDVEQMNSDEISDILNMDPKTIRVNLSRARKQIRERLKIICAYGTA